jgi:hypothetical protein
MELVEGMLTTLHMLLLLSKVCIHGLIVCFCSAKDWMFATEQFVQVFPDKVFVHRKTMFLSFVF